MNWEGFLMGISDFGLERLKEERQKKMQKELLELQQKFARESAEFTQKLKDKSDAKRVHETIETADGKQQGVNVFNQPVGEARELSPWEISKREREKEKHESDINYKTRQLDIQQDQVNAIRERSSAGVSGNDIEMPEPDLTPLGMAKQLLKTVETNPGHPQWDERLQLALDTLSEGYRNNWREDELPQRLLRKFPTIGGGTGSTRSTGP